MGKIALALVVEDDPRLREVVSQLLQLEGWAVQEAEAEE